MLPLGTPLPAFRLTDLDGRTVSSEDFRGTPILVAFICPHCPYVQHIRRSLAAFARDHEPRGLATVGINSNAGVVKDDDAEGMRGEVEAAGYAFPYLLDENQVAARAFRAACTPDLFLFGADGRLVYRGQFDGSRPGNTVPVTGDDLRAAAEALLTGRPVPETQRPSLGCNIKWKQGQEPEYARA
jgi:peroxiredoxin